MSSEEESSDDVPLAELIALRGNSPELGDAKVPKKSKQQPQRKTKKKKDPNEPQKPISAYALFFRDTQAAIKGQNPNASFGEVSKIVASMWDGLEPDAKEAYKKTAEASRKEYMKALALYKASLGSEDGEKPPQATKNKSPKSLPDPEKPDEDEEEEDIFEEDTTSKRISLADSPELCGGNDGKLKEVAEQKEEVSQVTISSDDDNDVKKTQSKKASEARKPSTPTQQQNASSKQSPVNGDLPDSDEVRQICLRNGCENLAIDSPEWDREYCSSECVVVHCRDVFNSWVTSKKMSPTL